MRARNTKQEEPGVTAPNAGVDDPNRLLPVLVKENDELEAAGCAPNSPVPKELAAG